MSDHGQSNADIRARLTGPGVYPVEYAHWLLNPLRAIISPAWMIVRRLELKTTDQVIEIGCGPGYFSPSVAQRLHCGSLTLYDLQPGMLEIAKKRMAARGLDNYTCRQGTASALPFPDNSFDVAFMVTVLGEVDDRQRAIEEAARVLRAGGRLSITEMFGDPDYVRLEELKERAEKAGLVLERRYGPRIFYTCNFRKPG